MENAGGCGYFQAGICRSCALLALPYGEQLRVKRQKLEQLLAPWSASIEAIEPVSRTFGSRNKAKLVVSGYAHQPVIGLLTEDFKSVPLPDCPLHHPEINEIAETSIELIKRSGLPPYDIERKRGELKYLIIRRAGNGDTLVRIVLRSKERLDRARSLAEALQKSYERIKVVSVNLQPLHAAILEGPEEIVLSQENFIIETLAGRQIALAPQSFSQVTNETAEKLYLHVSNLVAQRQPQDLFDLFCGAGGFAIFSAPHSGHVTGVEITEKAIEAAKLAVPLNQLTNVSFEARDVDQFLVRQKEDFSGTVIVNPPRRGVSDATIQRLKELKPEQIIYSSCNPQTLRRDLEALKDRYEVRSLKPFDMFPLTEHVEVVAELARHEEH